MRGEFGLRARAAALTAVVAAMSVIAANPARADVNYRDGLHVLSDVWTGGCTVNFSVDPTAGSEFATNMVDSLSAIAKVTGLKFNQVSASDDRAAIRYTVGDTQQDNAMGLASTDGNIVLKDAQQMPDAGNAKMNDGFRDRVVAHETLHALGLDHDSDTGSGRPDELMNPSQPWEPLKFGKGDLTGMKYIRDINECTPPAAGAPAPAPTVDASIASDPAAIVKTIDGSTGDSHAVTFTTIASGSGCAAVRSLDGTLPACTPTRHDDTPSTKPGKGTTTAPAPTTQTPPKRGDDTPSTKPGKGTTTAPAPTTQTPPKRGDSTPTTQTPPKRGEDGQTPKRETQAPAAAPAPAAPAPTTQTPPKRGEDAQTPRRENQAAAPAPAPAPAAPAPVAAAPAPAPVQAAPAPAAAPAPPRRESNESSSDRGHRDRD